MQKYYNDDKRQPTAEWIDYNFIESIDSKGRFIFLNKIKRHNQALAGEQAGSYTTRKNGIRYIVRFDGIKYENAGKLLWILKNDKPWPTDDSGKHLLVDHIDRNAENNFITNIRPATSSQNQINKLTTNAGNYRGIWKTSDSYKWGASIRYERKKIYLGRFENQIEAAIAYDNAAKELHGEYAVLNFPE